MNTLPYVPRSSLPIVELLGIHGTERAFRTRSEANGRSLSVAGKVEQRLAGVAVEKLNRIPVAHGGDGAVQARMKMVAAHTVWLDRPAGLVIPNTYRRIGTLRCDPLRAGQEPEAQDRRYV